MDHNNLNRSVRNNRYADYYGLLTTIFIIYKIRNQQGIEIFARLEEAYYNRDKALSSLVVRKAMLSSSEKGAGWDYEMDPVDIIDTLETSPT